MKFFNYHTVLKNTQKGFLPRELKIRFFLNIRKKNQFAFGRFFEKNVFDKKVAYCRKTLRETLQSHKTFFTNRKFQKIQGGTL